MKTTKLAIEIFVTVCLVLPITSYAQNQRAEDALEEGIIFTDNGATIAPFDATQLPTGAEMELKTKMWRDALRSLSAREKVPLFYQVYLKENVPYFTASKPLGVRSMDAFERTAFVPRVWKQIQGVQVFYADEEGRQPTETARQQVITWLSSLSDSEIKRLARSSLPLNRVPIAVEESINHALGWEDSDLLTLLWDRRSEFSLHLLLTPSIFNLEDESNSTSLKAVDLPLFKPLDEPLPEIVELPFLPLELRCCINQKLGTFHA